MDFKDFGSDAIDWHNYTEFNKYKDVIVDSINQTRYAITWFIKSEIGTMNEKKMQEDNKELYSTLFQLILPKVLEENFKSLKK